MAGLLGYLSILADDIALTGRNTVTITSLQTLLHHDDIGTLFE
ncbi:hypothetical protein MASR2M54_05950 [Aliarcobacter cryaerophilus]